MGLKICPWLKSWETFQLSVPSLLCFATKPTNKVSSSMLKIYVGSNKSHAFGLSYQPAHLRPCYSRRNCIKLARSANFDEFPDEELSKQRYLNLPENGIATLRLETLEPSLLGIQPEPPQWPERDEIVRISIEQRANRVEIPLSLRMIKRKQQWGKSLKEEGGLITYCSLKKAFSSMVFMIRAVQTYALHIRESLYCEDLQGVIDKVQREQNASFVWLFQQFLSKTPTLMVYVMILLANFMASSIPDNTIIATAATSPAVSSATITETKNRNPPQFIYYPKVVPDENKEASLSEEEVNLWKSLLEGASRMATEMRGEALDHETMQGLVSPVTVEVESDDYEDYFRTDLLYQMGLYQEPNNALLLSNYGQFLYLVAHDNDRAEECFKRAVLLEPFDAEGVSRYADFLWKVRKDLWGAEERYQQAMAAEPGNPYHASKYANFLWSTGGEETCCPLNTTHNDYN